MIQLPRLGLSPIHGQADWLPMTWALAEAIGQTGLHVQQFLSRACFSPQRYGPQPAAPNVRYLDSWLMSKSLCRELFIYGAQSSDFALVDGPFEEIADHDEAPACDAGPASFYTLCEWLDLPRLGLVDASLLGDCRLPNRPRGVDAILIDRAVDRSDFARLQTLFESLWGIPVLGGLPRMAKTRSAIADSPSSSPPSIETLAALGRQFAGMSDLKRILAIAASRPMPRGGRRALRRGRRLADITIAVAYDEAFHCYFPGTLDLLEMQGANVQQFSPLADDRLPLGTDVVYFGCGSPERFGERLAANRCMMMAVAQHAVHGGRVYAEGGGFGYLCQQMIGPDGAARPMAGVLPANAHWSEPAESPAAIDLPLSQDTWLGRGLSRLRGYRTGRWRLEPVGPMIEYAASESPAKFKCEKSVNLAGARRVLASEVHLDFAAQPEFLQAFFAPERTKIGVAAHG
jgi:cobyrinic acid a,c-diamide synthase